VLESTRNEVRWPVIRRLTGTIDGIAAGMLLHARFGQIYLLIVLDAPPLVRILRVPNSRLWNKIAGLIHFWTNIALTANSSVTPNAETVIIIPWPQQDHGEVIDNMRHQTTADSYSVGYYEHGLDLDCRVIN
jgi:hypothetical protein